MGNYRSLTWTGLVACALVALGCSMEAPTTGYRSALTGEACEPEADSWMPAGNRAAQGRGGHNSPTGIPGDNIDDPRSGKIDCLGDGNSGQGDDKKHGCQFPQPGCDGQGCCAEDALGDQGVSDSDDDSGEYADGDDGNDSGEYTDGDDSNDADTYDNTGEAPAGDDAPADNDGETPYDGSSDTPSSDYEVPPEGVLI